MPTLPSDKEILNTKIENSKRVLIPCIINLTLSIITNLFLVDLFVTQKYISNTGTRRYDILHLYLLGVLNLPLTSLYILEDIRSSPSDSISLHTELHVIMPDED